MARKKQAETETWNVTITEKTKLMENVVSWFFVVYVLGSAALVTGTGAVVLIRWLFG